MRSSKKRTKKDFMLVGAVAVILFASALIIGISTIGQTTIYNRPAFDPIAFELSVYDSEGADITDTFDDATISGVIAFGVTFTQGGERIHHVTLNITGTSEGASPGGSFMLDPTMDSNVWYISFDTTRLVNGDYNFDFIYTEEQPPTTYAGDPEIVIVPFSSFLFNMNSGDGTLSVAGFNMLFLFAIVVIIGIVAGSAAIYYIKPKSMKKRGML